MANQQIIAKKAAQAEAVKEKLQNAQSVVVVDYRGFSVAEVEELRTAMRNENVEYVVLKNGIVERAAELAGVDKGFMDYLKGPSAFAFGLEDSIAPARILKDFIKKTSKGEIKGGLFEGALSDAAELNKLASLPNRDTLIAMMMSSMKAPVNKFVIALNQIKEKLEANGGETAASVVVGAAAPETTAEAAPEVAPETAAEPVAEAAAEETTEA